MSKNAFSQLFHSPLAETSNLALSDAVTFLSNSFSLIGRLIVSPFYRLIAGTWTMDMCKSKPCNRGGGGFGVQGYKCTPKSLFLVFVKNISPNLKKTFGQRSFDILTIWMKLIIVYYVIESMLNKYKIHELFLVTSLMSNWLTWKFGQKKTFHLCFVNCTLRALSMLQNTYFILVESMLSNYRIAFVFYFNYSVWMNTFCHLLHVYVQLDRQC